MYKELFTPSPNVDLFEVQAKQWILDLLALSNEVAGHQKESVTPYMHVFMYHVPDQIRRHGSIRQFSGQCN